MRRAAVLLAPGLSSTAAAFPAGESPFDPDDPLDARWQDAPWAVRSEDWARAERLLAAEAPDVADVRRQLGFALRKQGRLEEAERACDRALTLAPADLGALEYPADLRIRQGDLAAAEALRARRAAACPGGCEELDELTASIAGARP
jgi:tetratricopeptide (TPR) repeat protein